MQEAIVGRGAARKREWIVIPEVTSAGDRVFDRLAALAARYFDAPMAFVSIVDGEYLWFPASQGMRHGLTRIAHADGLCTHAVSDGPYMVSDALADERTANRRLVVDHGTRFYACAPIVTADGDRLGAVAVMDRVVRSASEEQLGVLGDLAAIATEHLVLRLASVDELRVERHMRDVADYALDDAQHDLDTARSERDHARVDRDEAVRDRHIAEQERDVIEEYATVLQRTLLPPSLPAVPGLALAAHYYPASTRPVGGDFYDVFATGADRWAFFIGDVEGHGTGAAVATSLIRYTLRSAALHYADPIDVLAELNAVLMREVRPRRLCTVLFGTLQPFDDGDGFRLTIATGGHTPALLLDPADRAVYPVRSSSGMLMGATPQATISACSVRLRPGQMLLMYTDGLTEARRGKSPFDEDRLAEFALERAGLGAGGLVEELATLIPKLDPGDDVAVLAFGAV